MKAFEICNRLKITLENVEKLNGEVHSVHSRALNIALENGEFITVLSNEQTLGPNSILLSKKVNLKEFGFFQGLGLEISKEQINIERIRVNIGLKKAKVWDPSPNFEYNKAPYVEILDRLKLMEKLILKYGKLDGIAPVIFNAGKINEDFKPLSNSYVPMNQYSMFIIHRLLKFLDDVSKNQLDRLSESVKQVIGFGPGLTPSVDDLISGLMLSLVYLSHHFNIDANKVLQLNETIAMTALTKTTKISEEMLRFSSVGETTEANRRFIISLLSDTSEKKFTDNFENVSKHGDTSGTDFLCGVYYGFRILLNKMNKEVYVNGGQH